MIQVGGQLNLTPWLELLDKRTFQEGQDVLRSELC